MEISTDAISKVFGRSYFDLTTVDGIFTPHTDIQQPLTPEGILLEQARLRGEFPIFRTCSTPGGSPLTMHRMVQSLQEWFTENGHGKILYDTGRYQDEALFMEDTPRPGLVFVSREPVKGSTRKNYWQQTQLIAEDIDRLFEGREMPGLYRDGLDEWTKEKARLEKILTSDWRGAAKGLAELQINQELREKPVEALQSILVPFRSTGERRLQDMLTWTNAISSGGFLVNLGCFYPLGAYVGDWGPDRDASSLGVCLSRRFI